MSSTPGVPAPRLQVNNLSVSFDTERGRTQSVSDVSFEIAAGETLALVGESGSGKSVTSLSLMGLHAKDAQVQIAGTTRFLQRDGAAVDLLQLPEKSFRLLRGNDIAMIFQEPMTSLSPLLTVGDQVSESIRIHRKKSKAAALADARRLLELVEIPEASKRLHDYPHELSGGMRQRVMIALAMACDPTLLIADEPTTALDVTIQAQILTLIRRLQQETQMSVLFITHNLGVVAQYADHVAVMYAGNIVETAPVARLFARPAHPYTESLLNCLPALARKHPQRDRHGAPVLNAIKGQAPGPFNRPDGCLFHPRCPRADAGCAARAPQLIFPPSLQPPRHAVRCLKVQE